MKLILVALYSCIFIVGGCGHSVPLLTRDRVQKLLQNPPQNQEKLNPGTFNGCILVPASDFIQKLMVGFELTGETCSATVHQDNSLSGDFLGDTTTLVVSTSMEHIRTDTFIGELKNNQVLIVQHHQGKVVSVTQTIYDKNGTVVYGKFGQGDFIKECNFQMTSSEKSSGRKNCKK